MFQILWAFHPKTCFARLPGGIDDPEELAGMSRRTLKRKKPELELALQGYTSPHQRLLLKTILAHIDFLTEQMDMLDQKVARRLSPY
ncbi:hypothetical protein J2Z66_001137 [Paenibacillus eucommiae]|uniref:Uncharacterized protein n=1 Tax=Paenibacillus eucommiae TaxID=1355755 RepID=A0ABS4IPP4_9BACL|nr:hypothetical protein [Paenibacillus eucommiae]